MTARIAATFLLLSTLAGGSALADVVTFTSSQDNTLYVNDGELSSGAGPTMFCGRTGAFGTGARRALVQFDLSGIPAGSTVTAVQLRLVVNQTVSGTYPIALRAVTASWGEGTSDAGDNGGQGTQATANDATWLHRFYNGTLWTNPGGDFSAVTSATRNVTGLGAYTWGSTAQMVADVQAWVTTPASNFGYLLLGNEDATGSAKRFATREN
ncbi:MAG TPA: DNRLRE domain-containing protein, partial [Candidatus Eisenbacteria bacterium]